MFCTSILRHRTKYFIQFYHQFKTVQSIESTRPVLIRIMATKANSEFVKFDAKISLDNPLEDYEKLMEEKMMGNVTMTHEIYKETWNTISAAARETIWKLLFNDEKPADKEQLAKVAEFLRKHKEDACFHRAGDYNKWIVKVRDELLKRNMLEFWKNEMVAKELGPCWARDSDLFDDPDDPEPAKFYKYAGCEAAWLNQKKTTAAQNTADLLPAYLLSTETPKSNKKLKKISTETPLEDYKYNIEAQGDIGGDDEDAYKAIFAEAREVVWQLLFGETTLSPENSKKAAELLEEYKRDACFYNPWDYNDWVPTLRDELLKRKYFDFWQDIVVKKELGLCWARDSDYFDNMEDSKPMEFYKVGEDFIKQQKK